MSRSTILSRFHSPLRNLIPISHAFSRPFSARRSAPAEPPEPGGRHPKLFVVQPRLRPDDLLQAKLSEALNLANSLEEQRDGRHEGDLQDKKLPPFSVVQNPLARSGGHADTYFGLGTVENIKCQINATDSEEQSDAIFVNAVLSGVQQRNLERAWGKPVLDRIGLIIEIFNAHAQTKEAKLQSELAALMYKRTRLVRVRGPDGRLSFGISGESEVVSAKGKGSGGRGFLSGAGESEIQLQRQRIQERRDSLLHEIEEVRRTRALQRYARKRRGGTGGHGLATVAVVGYTNAGKSTLVSALSHNDLYKDDRLFATVDPRLRSVILPSGRKVLLSDTVGFISDLPVQLIEAFHATLEEVVDADLLVHVIDSCAKNVEEQRSAVLDVLNQIGVSEEKIRNMIEVWNKIDLLSSEPADVLNVEDDFDVCSDEEGCSPDQNEISSVRSLDENISECSESKDESDQLLTEGGHLEDGNGVCSESKDESDQLFTEGGYLEDGNANSQLNKVEDAFTHILFSGMMPKESHAVEHQGVTAYHEDESEVSSQDSQESFQKYADIDDAGTTNPEIQLHGGLGMGASAICHHKHARVETSAITGVGLKELLYIIDEKLCAREHTHHRVDYFGRKWRPSYSVDEGSTITQSGP